MVRHGSSGTAPFAQLGHKPLDSGIDIKPQASAPSFVKLGFTLTPRENFARTWNKMVFSNDLVAG